MREWYKNSAHQMSDPEMEHPQSIDPAACAVWEWAKGSCKIRDDNVIPEMGHVKEGIVARRLGIDAKRFRAVLKEMADIGWLSMGDGYFISLNGWSSWQSHKRSAEMDAKRKKDEYWKKKVEEGQLKLTVPGGLQEADFLKTWKEWIAYRRSHSATIADEKVLFQKQLNWLDDYGRKKAIRILDTAMRNGWQGLEAAAKFVESR